MNDTVTDFYAKNPNEDYGGTYDAQHGARLDAMVARFKLDTLKHERVLDVGGGLGFLGKRLDSSNDYWVIDGAEFTPAKRLCVGGWLQRDLDHDSFGTLKGFSSPEEQRMAQFPFDIGFVLETLEHLSNPYHCLVEMKKLVRIGGEIIISVPTETVWHNVVYPGLLWPRPNFEQFLGQMALPISEFWEFQPQPNGGWPAYHYRCANRPWTEKKLAFPKQEFKFLNATPLEATNL